MKICDYCEDKVDPSYNIKIKITRNWVISESDPIIELDEELHLCGEHHDLFENILENEKEFDKAGKQLRFRKPRSSPFMQFIKNRLDDRDE